MNANAVPDWRVIAASAPGTMHLEKALPCQDAHAFRILPGGVLLATVADGAGSAAHSQVGARLAVDAALSGLAGLWQRCPPEDESGWQAALAGLFAETRQKLADIAYGAKLPLQDYATTLTCALVTDDWLVVGQIGDGATICEAANGTLFLTAPPQRGEYANESYFLTQPEAADCMVVFAAHQPIGALALITDGLLRLALKLPGYEPHQKFFQPLLSFARETADQAQAQAELADFLASERVCARSDDDKTLLLAMRADQPGGRARKGKLRRREDARL